MHKPARFYVDFHVLQTVPPSCVNRDDTGSPKSALYGGVPRARVSSQAWKHAMRQMFTEIFPAADIGKRTKQVVEMVAAKITQLDGGCDAQALAAMAVAKAGLTLKNDVSGALFFLSEAQAEALAQLAVQEISGEKQNKKLYNAALQNNPSVDIVLFGRMAAGAPSLSYDAAAQVAHSISTHVVHNEYDFFTAVDDCAPEDNTGAAHLSTAEFNSATLYRYATVNVHELAAHLGADTAKVVRGFAQAFLLSMPTGKQNSFANRTVPDMVYVTFRCDQPVNLVGAFEKPVKSSPEGYVAQSKAKLIEYAQQTYRDFVAPPQLELCVGGGPACAEIAQMLPMPELVDALEDRITAWLAGDGQQA